jgi:hypothetical protein
MKIAILDDYQNVALKMADWTTTNLQNQDDVISIKASRVFPISISAAEARSHNYH